MQTGGPSGGCLPADLLHLEVGFDELSEAGSMMGSGGMIVMDEDNCMVDVAQLFRRLPDRGVLRQVPAVPRGPAADAPHPDKTSATARASRATSRPSRSSPRSLTEASLCGAGPERGQPLPEHAAVFPGGVRGARQREALSSSLSCKPIDLLLDRSRRSAQACLICLKKCPSQGIEGGKKQIHVIDQEKCDTCGVCYEVCPERFDAVIKISGEPVPEPLPVAERVLHGVVDHE